MNIDDYENRLKKDRRRSIIFAVLFLLCGLTIFVGYKHNEQSSGALPLPPQVGGLCIHADLHVKVCLRRWCGQNPGYEFCQGFEQRTLCTATSTERGLRQIRAMTCSEIVTQLAGGEVVRRHR